MLFNTIQYFVFLGLVFFGFHGLCLGGRRGAGLWLILFASFFFYAAFHPSYLLLLLFIGLVNFWAGALLEDLSRRGASRKARAAVMFVSAGLCLSLLGFFKYWDFFAQGANRALSGLGFGCSLPGAWFVLPVGISFYTLQGLSYTADVFRGRIRACRSLRDFMLFISFFPQLVAGPIVRAEVLLPQFEGGIEVDRERVSRGLFQVLCGIFKKAVIADLLASALVDRVFQNPAAAGLPLAWLALYGYALQIYCDFSGYSDVAIGSARMLGVEIPENFRRPYLARNLREFWRRWHISLSSWLRDYLYISLGGNRKGRARMYAAIFLTMFLGGMWHGAGLTFLAWGTYHGLLLMLTRAWQERKSRPGEPPAPGPSEQIRTGWRSKVFGWLQVAFTFHLVCLGWLLFRAQTLSHAAALGSRLFHGPWEWPALPPRALAVLGLGFFLHFSPVRMKERLEELFAGSPALVQAAGVALVLALMNLMKNVAAPFIYFQF